MNYLSAPYLSIIVPVYNVRAFLRECIDSVLNQTFEDYELIAINDDSPDGSGAILDEYQAIDSRVNVVHLPQNIGLGPARNEGIQHASGRYIVFLDSDDTLVPGALEAIADRLQKTHEPDVLVYDYARVYWNGSIRRNVLSDVLAEGESDYVDRDQRRDLLRVLNVAWNKAYRRDFVLQHGFTFPTGYYEDIPWTFPILITAPRIAVLDMVCYHYRQRRSGSILRTSSSRHLEVFDQYQRLFDYVGSAEEHEEWRTPLVDQMLAHLISVSRQKTRLDKSFAKIFFDQLAAAYRQYAPADHEPNTEWAFILRRTLGRVAPIARPKTQDLRPGGPKIRAIETSNYRLFRLTDHFSSELRKLKRAPKKPKRAISKLVKKARNRAKLSYYRAQLRRPIVEDLAVYASYWESGFACNPKAIYTAAARTRPNLHGVWVVKASKISEIPPGVDYVIKGSFPYLKLMATAKYFVNNVNFPTEIVKRPGQIYVQTNHGTPLKKMGLQLQDHPVGASGMSFGQLLKRCDRWDYLLSANRYSSEVWEQAYPAFFKTLEVGSPRNDRLVNSTPTDRTAIRESLDIPAEKIAILYAPTFRDWAKGGAQPEVDLDQLSHALGDDYIILVRGHYLRPKSKALGRLASEGAIRDVHSYGPVEDLLIASDVLLTDYSSIMFDFANLKRPIVLYANDWDTYSRVRGVNFDVTANPPGVVASTMDQLIKSFLNGTYKGTEATELREKFTNRFCTFEKGTAAERAIELTM